MALTEPARVKIYKRALIALSIAEFICGVMIFVFTILLAVSRIPAFYAWLVGGTGITVGVLAIGSGSLGVTGYRGQRQWVIRYHLTIGLIMVILDFGLMVSCAYTYVNYFGNNHPDRFLMADCAMIFSVALIYAICIAASIILSRIYQLRNRNTINTGIITYIRPPNYVQWLAGVPVQHPNVVMTNDRQIYSVENHAFCPDPDDWYHSNGTIRVTNNGCADGATCREDVEIIEGVQNLNLPSIQVPDLDMDFGRVSWLVGADFSTENAPGGGTDQAGAEAGSTTVSEPVERSGDSTVEVVSPERRYVVNTNGVIMEKS